MLCGSRLFDLVDDSMCHVLHNHSPTVVIQTIDLNRHYGMLKSSERDLASHAIINSHLTIFFVFLLEAEG